MEYPNNIACVTHSELMQDGLISHETYKSLRKRGQIKVIQRACYGKPALIKFNSLPDKYKAALKERGIEPGKRERSLLAQMVDTDFDAREFFASYTLADGRHLPEDKQQEYVNNTEILNAVVRLVNDRVALRKALGGNTKNIWPGVSLQVTALKVTMPHTLPDNHRRLRDKVSAYKRGSYESIISGKWLNSNAKKVAEHEQEATLRQLLRKHTNLDNEQIRELYNMVAKKLGWDTLSASTVANYRKKWSLEVYGGQRGETAFDNAKAMLVKRRAPALPLTYWTMDGWDVELLYQAQVIDDKGNRRTTYHNRLTVVVVLDPAAKYPVGYAIGTHETPELIKAALRDAVKHTESLFGQMHRVHQLQTDNYGKKSLTSFYEAVSDKFTPARVHNAKAKVIEPYFKRLNKKYCQLMNNWSGFGVKAKKESQPNGDYLSKIRHSFPDQAGCRLQIERIMELERAANIDKYKAAYNELPEADRRVLSGEDYLYLLGETTGYTNRLGASGIIAKIAGAKREYDCFNADFRRLAHVDWTLKFDPEAPETVLAVNADGTRRFMLSEKYVQPMALYDRQEGDAEKLAQVRAFNADMKEDIMNDMGQDQALVDGIFSNNPQLNDTLTKFVLCDSNGQHKNNKSAARLAGQKLLQKTEKAEAADWQAQQMAYLNSKVDINKFL